MTLTYIRNAITQHRGAGKRKAGPPRRGGYRQARLGNEIIILCNAWIKPLNMQQMGVFFAEGMCFDTSMEGNGGPAGGVPHYAKGRVRCPRDPGPQMVGDGQDRAHALG